MHTTGDGAARRDARGPRARLASRHADGHREAAAVALTAGQLSVGLVGGDARQVRWGGREAVARVYVGVRDAEWGTVPAAVRLVSRRRAADSFEIRLAGRNGAPSLAVSWEAVISGAADGVFRYSLVATLDEPSRYDRIGLCVLHRARYLTGSTVAVRQVSGTAVHAVRPTVEPQWCIDGIELGCTEPCCRLEFTTAAGLHVVEEFEGCAFELEDERNFGDGFLKAYGPPLREGYPREAPAGTVIRQRVTVRLSDAVPAGRWARTGHGARVRRPRRVRVELGPAAGAAMPGVGVHYRALPPSARGGQARDGAPGPVAAALATLSPSHLRCEVDPQSPHWRRDLDAAFRLGAAASVPLEIAVSVGVPSLAALGELAALAGRGKVARLLLGAVGGGAPTAAHLEAARRVVGGAGWDMPVFAATAGDVCELIRDRPGYPGHVGVAFATNPQVHLTDDDVIFEGLFGQSAAARTVRELYPAALLAVSPVTLRTAAGPGGAPDDPRLAGMCGAAWAAGSVQALAAAGVAAVTFGLPLAGDGPGGALRPVFHVLAAAAGMSGRPLLETGVDDQGLARAFGIDTGDRWRVVVTNLTPQPLWADIAWPGDARSGRAWVLDEPTRRGRERVHKPTRAGRDQPAGGSARGADSWLEPGGGRMDGAPWVPWRPAGMAPGARARAFPLRLAGYGVALFELARRQGGGMAGGLGKGGVPRIDRLDRPNEVCLSYQQAT